MAANPFIPPIPEREIEPLTPARLGIPVKADRFGLAPLPFPSKAGHDKKTSVKNNFKPFDKLFNKRIGNSPQTTTTQKTISQESEDAIEKLLNRLPVDLSTSAPIESTTDETHDFNPEEYNDSKEQPNPDSDYANTESELLAEIMSKNDESNDTLDSSPTPTYIPTTVDPEVEATTKTGYLHQEEFANFLNNMYYQKPEVIFESMADQYESNPQRALNSNI